MGKNFRETLNELLKDPEFKDEWDTLEPEYQIVREIIHARNASGMTQTQLSDISGVSQADISRLENGSANPSLKTLKRIASAMGMKLEIRFVPKDKQTSVSPVT